MTDSKTDELSDDGPAMTWSGSARALLDRHGLRAKRTLGQNFLADTGLCARIAALTQPESGAAGSVLEIGAGMGALTEQLLAAGHRVTAVETDRELCPLLRERFSEALSTGRLQLLEADARALDFGQLLDAMPAPRILAGNLPYHLSGLLLRRAVDVSDRVQRSVFLLQLEVADRLCAAPGSAAYGALSVFAQAVYEPRRAFVVRRGAFFPQPGVDSASVVLSALPAVRLPTPEFSRLVKAAFEQRRKTLRNAWKGVLGLSASVVQAAAAEAQIDLGARGETLAVDDYRRMEAAVCLLGPKQGAE